MDGENEANMAETQGSLEPVKEMVVASDAAPKVEPGLEERKAEIQSLEREEKTYEFAEVDLDSLSKEQLKAHVEILGEQIDQAKKRMETNRRAVNLGLLKKANRAPRCAQLKSDGQPCRAPAVGSRWFCVFHTRAVDTELNKEKMRIGVLENRESVQIAVKQIMEHIIDRKVDARDAALLFRGVQIAGSTLKAEKDEKVQAPKGKPPRSESDQGRGNAVENAG
ncbi:MAG TPA: hypothetical protein VJT08_17005 [Terriglobales bacterium]|nr:hypothetical protein [Terriglobales bacterium]